MSEFNQMNPGEYASLWGCDGSYDRFPNKQGDGGMFYRYEPGLQDRSFLINFVGAIHRQIWAIDLSPASYDDGSKEDLQKLLDFVLNELKCFKSDTKMAV